VRGEKTKRNQKNQKGFHKASKKAKEWRVERQVQNFDWRNLEKC
jgi:hypothetical protein